MVFGNTYCAISRLEIKDGDRCILFPIGFRMDFKFDYYNKADINCFSYLYNFIDKPVEVIFEGNYSKITYLNDSGRRIKKGDEYKEYELFILIHYDFYIELISSLGDDIYKYINHLPSCRTTFTIDKIAHQIEKESYQDKSFKYHKGLITSDELNIRELTPEWIKNVYKVGMFMDKLNIPLCPTFCVDQVETNKLYEKLRNKFL